MHEKIHAQLIKFARDVLDCISEVLKVNMAKETAHVVSTMWINPMVGDFDNEYGCKQCNSLVHV